MEQKTPASHLDSKKRHFATALKSELDRRWKLT